MTTPQPLQPDSPPTPMMRRAVTFDELDDIIDRMFPDESRDFGRAFVPRPTDIFITPYGKSGTTWLQQIAHGLRTGGSMNFEEITTMTPWPTVARTVGWDLEAEQVAEPRLYKSHDPYDLINKGARYIVAVRDPAAVLVSGYRFFENWLFEPGSFSLEDYVKWNWPLDEEEIFGWWRHFNTWWEQRHNPDVLLMGYEDMTADHIGTVRRVARFMGLDPRGPAVGIATYQSTRPFMMAHAEQFNDHPMRRAAERLAGVPPRGQAYKVTSGDNSPDRYRLTPGIREHLDALWQRYIVPQWGFPDYAALRREIARLTAERDAG